ncbi:MAG TPA: hypothetical protein VFV65_06085 [Gemmatimonadales bacterium]|nr:hypothetical protein [Gemmatimonadales bacterium]
MHSISIPDPERLHRLRGGAVMAPAPTAIFRVAGPGALTCLQGLWTNDLLEPGPNSLVYGALLTPKGMIVADGWAVRDEEQVFLLLAPGAREAVALILQRSLPPRLATATDLSDTSRVLHLLGDAALERWPVVPLGRLPDAGAVARGEAADEAFLVGTPAAGPFAALLLGESSAIDAAESVLAAAGLTAGNENDREAARVIAGWPALGAEIDDRTLPQEVRFDEHAGVSYTKGCYTGQETVARLHFRGHTNRVLRGLRWSAPPAEGDMVQAGEKQAGRVTSILVLPDRCLGLGVVRRELDPGSRVTAGGSPAIVTDLPFGTGDLEG